MAHSVELQVPEKLGSPGEKNGAFRANRGPSVTEVQHSPILPKAGETVTVTARIGDVDGVIGVQLSYGIEGTGSFVPSSMSETSTPGIYAGQILGQAANTLVAFYILVTDGQGESNFFPADPINEPYLYQVAAEELSNFPVYRILFPSSTRQKLSTWPRMSNHLLPCVFIYDDTEVYYNCRVRFRGSPFIRGTADPVSSKMALRIRFPADKRLHGRPEMNLDTMRADCLLDLPENRGSVERHAVRSGALQPDRPWPLRRRPES
jgi:hypothetical protein